jgi:hypothetical protein
MATKFTYKEEKPPIRKECKEYIIQREVKALAKELKAHEKEPMSKAHPKK